VSIDPRFERFVLAELALRERRVRRHDGLQGARVLAQRLHRGRDDLLAHLRRVAHAVPRRFRPVAWLHHAHEADVRPRTLSTVGLSKDEMSALELLAAAGSSSSAHPLLDRIRTLSTAPGSAGYLARVVARAAIEDRLGGARPVGETLTALCLLPDPRLAASVVGQRLLTSSAPVAMMDRGPNDAADMRTDGDGGHS
jgi:hypothetical protein